MLRSRHSVDTAACVLDACFPLHSLLNAFLPTWVQVIWAPLLGALSTLFDEYTDPRLIKATLAGFAAGCHLTALVREVVWLWVAAYDGLWWQEV